MERSVAPCRCPPACINNWVKLRLLCTAGFNAESFASAVAGPRPVWRWERVCYVPCSDWPDAVSHDFIWFWSFIMFHCLHTRLDFTALLCMPWSSSTCSAFGEIICLTFPTWCQGSQCWASQDPEGVLPSTAYYVYYIFSQKYLSLSICMFIYVNIIFMS